MTKTKAIILLTSVLAGVAAFIAIINYLWPTQAAQAATQTPAQKAMSASQPGTSPAVKANTAVQAAASSFNMDNGDIPTTLAQANQVLAAQYVDPNLTQAQINAANNIAGNAAANSSDNPPAGSIPYTTY